MSSSAKVAELYAALVAADPMELLAPLVSASHGELLEAAREDVVYRPGRNASVRFAAQVRRAGVTGREGWVVHAAEELPAGTMTLDGPAGRVAAWRVRDDPGLPGLRSALDRDAVAGLLGELGLPSDGLGLQLLAYRPQRRAVISASTSAHRVFVKCLPPEKVAALHDRHAAFRAADVPAPRSLGYDAALGLIVLTPLPGDPLRPRLLGGGAALPDPVQVRELLERVRQVELAAKARAPLRQAGGHGALLRSVLPSAGGQIDDLLDGIRTETPSSQDRQVVHGDFYDGQLLVRADQIVGVVDIDGAGQGHPADDAATLLAHLHVLTTLAAEQAGVHHWLPLVAEQVGSGLDPHELRRRTAAVLLGLATWPHSRRSPGWEARTQELLDLTDRVLRGN